ncbi:MAG: hypothetical protein WB511_01920 [Nitrososphaeraceae archaeon]
MNPIRSYVNSMNTLRDTDKSLLTGTTTDGESYILADGYIV